MLQEKFSYPGVNWCDGMSINKEHFIAQENHLKEVCMDAVGINLHPYSYGLLPWQSAENRVLRLEIDSRQVLHVQIENLRAVTMGGARVEITPSTVPHLELTLPLDDLINDDEGRRTFALVLTVNPYSRQASGHAHPDENPPRKPYVLPQYELNLLPVQELGRSESGLFHLTLGLLTYMNGEFAVMEEYIPACTSMESSPELLEYFARIERAFTQLERYSIKIVQKVRSKQQKNNLALSINSLSEQMLHYLGQQMPGFRLYLRHQPPVYTLEKVVSLGRLTHNSIESWQGNGKEELLNYLTEWCDLNQGVLDKTLAELAQLSYQHNHAVLAFRKADNFLRIMVPLFKILSELDYIGKQVDTNLFVTEEIAVKEEGAGKSVLKGWFRK